MAESLSIPNALEQAIQSVQAKYLPLVIKGQDIIYHEGGVAEAHVSIAFISNPTDIWLFSFHILHEESEKGQAHVVEIFRNKLMNVIVGRPIGMTPRRLENLNRQKP